jgi:riboflavin synthase
MFTGIITDIGRIAQRVDQGSAGDRLFLIETRYDVNAVDLGASIACNGCCLTVTDKGKDGRAKGNWFTVEASQETLSKTTLGDWREGTRINLERSLRLGDELGGHLVYGHVDGVGRIVGRRPEGGSVRFTVEAPEAVAKYVASKGSVAIDGVSLTVNEVAANSFGVNIIAHTQHETTFGGLEPGQAVNLEVDMLARYVARLLGRDTL